MANENIAEREERRNTFYRIGGFRHFREVRVPLLRRYIDADHNVMEFEPIYPDQPEYHGYAPFDFRLAFLTVESDVLACVVSGGLVIVDPWLWEGYDNLPFHR
jgi:hypothetical protein